MTEPTPEPTWTATPAGAGTRRWFDGVLSLFALMLMLVAAGFCTITIWTGSPELVTAYGVLVFCFGVWFLLGRRIGRRRRRRASRYQISEGSLTVSVRGAERVIPLPSLSDISVQTHKDGTGTVWGSVDSGPLEPLLEAVSGPDEVAPLLSGSGPDPGEPGYTGETG